MTRQASGLYSRDFIVWLAARFASNIARKMTAVALAWQVYQITKDPLALGFLGLAEALPFLTVSLWSGHWVDRHQKKFFMLGADGLLLLSASLFLGLTFWPGAPLAMAYAGVGLTGVAVSFGSVASSVFVQMLVPSDKFSRAAAWNLAAFTTAVILGPLLGGWILSISGARLVYGTSLAFFTAAMALTSALRSVPKAAFSPDTALVRVKEGIRFVRSEPLILACMSLDMLAVLFGDAVAVFPLFADFLNSGPMGFGILRASPPLGSALVSLVQASRPFIRPSWGGLKKAAALFGAAMIGFALSRNLFSAVFFLMLSGAFDAVSVIIRQSIYQARTPDHLRGRVAALSGIFISASNEIGAFESGLAARLMGPVPSVVFGGLMTWAGVGFMKWKFRHLRND